MKNSEEYNTNFTKLSVEDFDQITEEHKFSDKYKIQKDQILKNYQKRKMIKILINVAAVFMLFCILIPNTINSATNYIAKEELPYVRELDGHTLTVLSVLQDKNSAILEFTLEKEDKVTLIDLEKAYSDYVTYHGSMKWDAWGKDTMIHIGLFPCDIKIDFDRSTENKIYGTIYTVLEQQFRDGNEVFSIGKYLDKLHSQMEHEKIVFVNSTLLDTTELTSETGGAIEISKISMCVDLKNESNFPVLPNTSKVDRIEKIQLNFKDGTEYFVNYDSVGNINVGYCCAETIDKMTYIFIESIDVDHIESIILNDIEFTKS